MALWNQGQSVDMLGPLGTGFSLQEGTRRVVMIAGGMGIASLFGLAEWILRRKEAVDIRIGIGGKSKEDILMTQELRAMGARVEVTTEDGTMGTKGLVTDWFENQVPLFAQKKNTTVCACGPLDMLARVSAMTQRVSLPCQVSLEARMACGVGACLGCAVKTGDKGYQLVCKSGPVFDATEIDWENMGRLL
jgi:dihydroorotate dehydrogenase electron transfer subunit